MAWLEEQKALVDNALDDAPDGITRYVLGGTIGDARSFCWGALRQFDRRSEQESSYGSAREAGLNHADLHLLLIMAQETVSHVEVVERLLDAIEEPRRLPPDRQLRRRLRVARNLLAEHRDERVLYRRLTLKHTPHVERTYKKLCVPLPTDSIDSETLPFPGMLGGGLLSLRTLYDSLLKLEGELAELAEKYRGQGEPPAIALPTTTVSASSSTEG